MAFDLDDFYFLFFWSAATNALMYWEFLRYFNAARYPQHVTQSHWVVKFIRLLPRAGKWAEVSLGLRHQVSELRGYAPFTYQGIVEFLTIAEDVLDTLGSGQRTRQEDADQLRYDVLIEPIEHMDLPVTTTTRNALEIRQMRALSMNVLKLAYVSEWLNYGVSGLKQKGLSILEVCKGLGCVFEN